MNLIFKTKSQLRQDLRIPYLTSPENWPGQALSGQMLNCFDAPEDFQFTEVQPTEFTKIGGPSSRTQEIQIQQTNLYFQLHSKLSLLQKLVLLQSPAFADFFDLQTFFSHLPPRSQSELMELSKIICNLPEKFKKWVHEKDLHFFDLAPLLSIKSETAGLDVIKNAATLRLQSILENWDQIHFSKSQGIQALELLVELILLNTKSEELILDQQIPAEDIIKKLKLLRYPKTLASDEEKKNNSLLWPTSTQVQAQRRGDRWGYNIHFFVSGPQELTKTIEQFQKAAEQWKNQSH